MGIRCNRQFPTTLVQGREFRMGTKVGMLGALLSFHQQKQALKQI